MWRLGFRREDNGKAVRRDDPIWKSLKERAVSAAMTGSFLYVYAASAVLFLMTLAASGLAETHTFYAWLAATTISFFPLAWVETVRIKQQPRQTQHASQLGDAGHEAPAQLSPPSEDREMASQALR